MVILDTTMLLLFLNKDTRAPAHVSHPQDRVRFLIDSLQKKGEKIIIPTPVLTEVLILSGSAGESYLPILEKYNVFKIASFDVRAAVTLAILSRSESKKHGNKRGPSVESWAKVKYDRQIVSIGMTLGVSEIYSDDKELRNLAQANDIKPFGLADLILPPQAAQQKMFDAS